MGRHGLLRLLCCSKNTKHTGRVGVIYALSVRSCVADRGICTFSPSTARSMMDGRYFLVLTGACQFGHGVGGFAANFIHSAERGSIYCLPLTAGSTHEAELISMSFAADEAVWIRRLLLEVGFAIPGVHHIRSRTDDDDDDVFPSVETQTESWIASMRPTWLLGDNQSAIFTAGNPETSQRSKHLEIRWFRIRDYIRDLTLRVRHIPTQHNIADFFTKSLQGMDSFDKHRQSLMGRQDFSPWKSIPESEA